MQQIKRSNSISLCTVEVLGAVQPLILVLNQGVDLFLAILKPNPHPLQFLLFFLFFPFFTLFFKPFSKTGFWQISLPVSTPDSTGQSAHTDVDVLTTPDDKINRFTQHSFWSPLWPLIHKLTPTKMSSLHQMHLKGKLCSSGCRSTVHDKTVPIKVLS